MLQSMRVLSFCHILQGPAGVQYLADAGADVINIEPLRGDGSRKWAGADIYPGEVSAFYLCAARNKKSVAVDLKSPEGKEIIWKLIAETDVVVENFRSGVMDRLGFSFEEMKKVNPDIIYASATGWGNNSGPMVGREGQDMLMQARSGLIHATGTSRPTAVGGAVVDQHGGTLIALGIMAAFIRRQATGQGARVESSLFGAALDLQVEPLTAYLTGKKLGKADASLFRRNENLASWYHFAPYGVYRLADAWIAVPNQDPKLVANAMNNEVLREIAKDDVLANRDAFASIFGQILRKMTLEEVDKIFRTADIWYAKCQSYDDVEADPQAAAMEAFREIEVNGDKAVLVNHPVRYDGKVPPLHTLALNIGSHTEEVLTRLGYSKEKVAELARKGAVATPDHNVFLGLDGDAVHEKQRHPRRENGWALVK